MVGSATTMIKNPRPNTLLVKFVALRRINSWLPLLGFMSLSVDFIGISPFES